MSYNMASEKAQNVLNRRNVLKLAGVASLAGFTSQSVAGNKPDNPGTGPQNSFEPLEATVADIRQSITNRQATAESITKQYLERIDAYDDALNAIITVNDQAIERAQTLDDKFEESGLVGPLHGVPLVLKDNNDTAELPTTGGSLSLEDSVPPDDAFIVSELRSAGAIVVAKANLHEYALGYETVSSLGGQTRNPYALGRVPGGSSGGTGAAIGANFGVLGTGTDTCGSVRVPAAFNNAVGIRPTIGLVSRDGIIPLILSQDTAGPITRTVEDAAIMLEVMAGYDPSDPVTARGADEIPSASEPPYGPGKGAGPSSNRGEGPFPTGGYAQFLNEDGLENARIGVLRQLFGADEDAEEGASADAAQVTAVVDDALNDMAASGATIVDPVEISDLEALVEDASTPFLKEFKRDLNNYFDSLGVDAAVDSVTELAESDEYACAIADTIRGAADAEVEDLENDPDYESAFKGKYDLVNAIEQVLADEDLDAILYPTVSRTIVEVGGDQEGPNCDLSAVSGLPAITVPGGFTDKDELPVGIEMLGREFAEPTLIELGYAYEQATQNRRQPDQFGALPTESISVPNPDFTVDKATDGCSSEE
ncbi:amidase family protein [Halorubrum sp. CBA1229]|uniref:amidase family protein n=1 Tax=Halorubrum sp. CBA1229 TaxID=1853699 RepID=UPI0020D1D4E2|nr:amidase family protein [Halorubrum sp. CBA1229]